MGQTVLQTPIGGIGLLVEDGDVVAVSFGATVAVAEGRISPGGAGRPAARPATDPADSPLVLATAALQLREYFAGERTEFELPLKIRRGSEFERAVWAEIAVIPYGETRSYGAIARSIGEPGGSQAVGMACNRNPLPLVIPCHRVIGSDGKLVGFGGGLDRKRWLLSLEARIHMERLFTTGW